MIEKGDRVELLADNIENNIPAGTLGIVKSSSSFGWYDVLWDNNKTIKEHDLRMGLLKSSHKSNYEGQYLARYLGYMENVGEDGPEQWSLIYDKLFENGFEIVKRVESYVPIPEVEE